MKHRSRHRKAWFRNFFATRYRRLVICMVVAGLACVASGTWLLVTTLTKTLANDNVRETIQPTSALRHVTAPGSQIIALRHSRATSSPLLLFFPATGASTSQYGAFENEAAKLGYHVVALPYANMRTERSLCLANANCYGQIRDEQLTGSVSHYLPPSAHEASIQAVLPAALKTLQKRDPNGDWTHYLRDNNSIDWSNVVVAGHSQGGGLAAYVAHQKNVKGVIMFSSPNDMNPRTHTVAAWLKSNSATPDSRYYGFMNTHDSYALSTTTAWRTMLPDLSVKTVDGTKDLSGQLLSSATLHFPSNLSAHFAAARDPAYTYVWDYLLQQNR